MDSSSDSEAPMPAEGGSSPPRSAPPKPYPPSPLLKDRLAQLRQSATCDDALLSLKQIVREMQPSAVPRFLTHLQSETSGSPRKPAYSHHAISLYVSLAREHKDKLVPQIPRVMRNLMLHLKSPGVGGSIVGSPGGGGLEASVHGACVQVVLELARIPIKDENAKAQLLQDICSPLIGALSKTENGPLYGVPTESFGAAHCLKALVDASDIWQHASDGLVDDVCSEIAEALQVEGAATFLQLACSLARCNTSVCQHYASDLLRAGGHALQWRSASWQQRFAAAKLYTEVLSRVDQDVALSLEKSALNVLESCQTSDPSPYVCAQVVDAIRALEARTNRPLLRGPRTPDASPPRRTPQASPPSKTPPGSPPQSGLKPTASAESPKMAPKRSKLNEAVLASADWPSEDPNNIFGGSPIYDVLTESDESPLLLLKSRGVTSQGSGKMTKWSEERTSGEQGLGFLAERNDWRRSAKLMQSAEWPTLASGSPVYDPDDLDLTLEGLDECPVESTEAFFPATQLSRTPQRTTPVEEAVEQPASPELTPVVALARTPMIAPEANEAEQVVERAANLEATPVVALARTPNIAPEAAVMSESLIGKEETTDKKGEPLNEDHTPPSSPKHLELSDKMIAPEAAVKSERLSEAARIWDEDQTSPDPSELPVKQLPAKIQPEALFVSKIPRPPSTRTNSDQTTEESSTSNDQEPTKESLRVDTTGVPTSPSAEGSPPQKSPSRIPTPTSTPRPKASIVGSHIPPPPSLTRFQTPQSERQQRFSAQQEKREVPNALLKKGSFEERLSKVSNDKALVKEIGRKAEQMLKEAKPSRRKSSLGPSDFLSTSPRQMLRRLAAESPAKESPTTTPRSVLAVRAPRGDLPSTFSAADFTPPDTPVGEGAVNGVSENGSVIDMDVEEHYTPAEKEEQKGLRKWSVNGGKAAGRYSLDADSDSETEESGAKEPGQSGNREEQDEQSGERTGGASSTEATADEPPVQELPSEEKRETSEKDEANGVSKIKSEETQSDDPGSKTSAEGLSGPLDNEWHVHENPIAGRPSTSSGWDASETTFDDSTLRRMSEGEEVSSPEGFGVWEERHVAEMDSMSEQDPKAPSEKQSDRNHRTEKTDASEEAKENDENGKEDFTSDSVMTSEMGVNKSEDLGQKSHMEDSASEFARVLSGDEESGAECARSSDVRLESNEQPESGSESGEKPKGERLQEDASKGDTKSGVVEGRQAEHETANEEMPPGTSDGSASEIKSPDAASTSEPKSKKKRVSFSEHDEIQMIEPNPPPETRLDEHKGVNLRKWVKLAEKGVKSTVITIATLELGVLFYVVSRGVWEAYCAPAFNVPLPS